MQRPSIPFTRALSAATIAALCLLAFPQTSPAKDKGHGRHSRGRDSKHGQPHNEDRGRVVYLSRPRSGFTLSFGSGYAGRGYYYGPPNSNYYYQRPDVRYYSTREAAPREYYSGESYRSSSSSAAVQNALSRRGYYRGAIDGQIGPQSRNAIARYQETRGMQVTGNVSSSLLRDLGLE